MGEFREFTAPKELKTIEMDIEKRIFKINGDDVGSSGAITIHITGGRGSVEVITTADIIYRAEYKRENGKMTAL